MIIDVKNLVKKYGDVKALDSLSLQVQEGEILGLLGPNGSGKTTAIHCMLSLLKYDQGDIEIFGKKMDPQANDSKAKIGIVPQNVAVFYELSVQENIDYFCGLYIKDKLKRKKYTQEAIAFVNLDDYAKYKPGALSGGLLRRLNIACGIAHQPSLIFLDEPTVAVDPQSRNAILEGIVKLNQRGATIVYTTHYMEEVEEICSRIIIMDKGKTIISGSKEELKASVKIKERVTLEDIVLETDSITLLKAMPGVDSIVYEHKCLTMNFCKGEQNIIQVIQFMKNKKLSFKKVYSQLPTLNDVFLEITGKDLRD